MESREVGVSELIFLGAKLCCDACLVFLHLLWFHLQDEFCPKKYPCRKQIIAEVSVWTGSKQDSFGQLQNYETVYIHSLLINLFLQLDTHFTFACCKGCFDCCTDATRGYTACVGATTLCTLAHVPTTILTLKTFSKQCVSDYSIDAGVLLNKFSFCTIS